MSANGKLKILCLHGYRQDAEVFRNKIGGFRKNIKNTSELVFIDAPHVIPQCILENPTAKPGRSWWFSTEDDYFNSKIPTDVAKGFQDSVNAIAEAFQTQGPFDGILGFSQGASLASLICGLKEIKEFQHSFQFAILISGFRSVSNCHQYIYQTTSTVHNLHIIGKNDQCISTDSSEELMKTFQDPCVIYHNGGHMVPSQSSIKIEYVSFIEKMLKLTIKD